MLGLTLGLGLWQVQRLHWKRAILADIDQGEVSSPEPLAASSAKPFHRVVATGTFLPGTARYGAEVRVLPGLGPTMGAHVVSPLATSLGRPVLIDRGWAPMSSDPPLPAGQVSIVGYVRPPERSPTLGVKDDPAARRFFALDPAAMGSALGFPTVAPFTIVALGPPGTIPEPAAMMPRPPNDHLSYALTWFGLSAVLVVVFGVFAARTLREGSVT